MTRVGWLVVVLIGALALTAVLSIAVPTWRATRYRQSVLMLFQSRDVEDRKRAAWTVVERPDETLTAFMVRGVTGGEPDSNVREAYIYALGKLRDRRHFAAIEYAIDADPSGYVRAAAWLAAARSDPGHFRTLAGTRTPPVEPWDAIGTAQGRLRLGDVGAVGVLLEQAVEGDETQRLVAGRAMFKWLRPLLDVAGRWPVDAEVAEGEAWPAEVVAEVKRRCAELDLQAIADTIRRHQVRLACVRGKVRKLTGAREDLAELLFAE